jgi:hypothetical protein
MDMRLRTWNDRSLHRAGSLESESTYKQQDNGGSEPTDVYIFIYGNGNGAHYLKTGFFIDQRIISAVKKVEFISSRMLCIILRGH